MPIDVRRHLAATLAYRAAQILGDAPPGFAASTFAPSTRQPAHIVAHMADLMAWGVTLARADYPLLLGRDDNGRRSPSRSSE